MAEHHLAAEKIVVVPEGIDTARFDPAPSRRKGGPRRARASGSSPIARTPVILLAARLASWKGHLVAMEAMARRAGRGGAILVLAGTARDDRPYARSLRAAVQRLGIGAEVRWADTCEDMPAALAAADLVIAPSTRAESFGRTVVEAAAMARPGPGFASGRARPRRSPDGATGWLVPPADIPAWAAALDRALGMAGRGVARHGSRRRASGSAASIPSPPCARPPSRSTGGWSRPAR